MENITSRRRSRKIPISDREAFAHATAMEEFRPRAVSLSRDEWGSFSDITPAEVARRRQEAAARLELAL